MSGSFKGLLSVMRVQCNNFHTLQEENADVQVLLDISFDGVGRLPESGLCSTQSVQLQRRN
jgi:hypothetical protein